MLRCDGFSIEDLVEGGGEEGGIAARAAIRRKADALIEAAGTFVSLHHPKRDRVVAALAGCAPRALA